MKDMTLINVILDRSGSMHSIADEAVGMFNAFIEKQQRGPDYAELSLVQFDQQYEICYLRKPIKECPPLVAGETYHPRGMTALPEDERPARVLFVILTDGQENSSREYNHDRIQKMIARQRDTYNWDFIFLAAGLEAFTEGAKIGMPAHKCASVDHSARGMAVTLDGLDSYTTAYRSTGDTSQDVEDHL